MVLSRKFINLVAIKSSPRIYISLVVLLIGLCAFIFFYPQATSHTVYISEPVSVGNIEIQVVATGTVSAAQTVIVGAQATGQVKKLHVRLGQEVQQGDLIAEIDSTTQINDLNTNKATLQTEQAQLASREIALRIAQLQYNRAVRLRREDATSRENLENLENAFAAAKAAVTESKSRILQAQTAVSTAEANLGYTRITAPIAGTVIALAVEEGQTVNAVQTTPAIVTLADLSHMEIKLQISEGDVAHVTPSMKVTFNILSYPKFFYETILASIDPAPSSIINPQQGDSPSMNSEGKAIYYYGRLLVENTDNTLRIGMTTLSRIHVGSVKDVLCVPSIAVHEEDGAKYVFVLDSGKSPAKRIVTTGLSDNMQTEITSGLQAGEEVITSQMTMEEINESIERANE